MLLPLRALRVPGGEAFVQWTRGWINAGMPGCEEFGTVQREGREA